MLSGELYIKKKREKSEDRHPPDLSVFFYFFISQQALVVPKWAGRKEPPVFHNFCKMLLFESCMNIKGKVRICSTTYTPA